MVRKHLSEKKIAEGNENRLLRKNTEKMVWRILHLTTRNDMSPIYYPNSYFEILE